MSAQQRNDGSSTSIWACSGDTLEIENLFFKHAIKHTPGESAVAAAALECEVRRSPDPVRVSCRSASSALSRKVIVALLKRPPAGKSGGLFEGCHVSRKVCCFCSRQAHIRYFGCGSSKNVAISLSSKSGRLAIVTNKVRYFLTFPLASNCFR